MSDWFAAHWLEWAGVAGAGAGGWLLTQTIAKPLVQFWADRRSVIEALRMHDSVGWHASADRVREAEAAIQEAAARVMFYAEAGPMIVRLYSKFRGYDLSLAGRALNGVHERIGAHISPEIFSLQSDAVRVCLGATIAMSPAHREAIRRLLLETIGKNGKGGSS